MDGMVKTKTATIKKKLNLRIQNVTVAAFIFYIISKLTIPFHVFTDVLIRFPQEHNFSLKKQLAQEKRQIFIKI